MSVCPPLWLAANYAAFTYVVCGQQQQQRRQRLRQRIGNVGTYVWAKSAVCLVAVAAAANFVLCVECILCSHICHVVVLVCS